MSFIEGMNSKMEKINEQKLVDLSGKWISSFIQNNKICRIEDLF